MRHKFWYNNFMVYQKQLAVYTWFEIFDQRISEQFIFQVPFEVIGVEVASTNTTCVSIKVVFALAG